MLSLSPAAVQRDWSLMVITTIVLFLAVLTVVFFQLPTHSKLPFVRPSGLSVENTRQDEDMQTVIVQGVWS